MKPGEFQPEPDHLPGAIDDARPDQWGERVIRHIEAPRRLSILEYLFFAGDDRFGVFTDAVFPRLAPAFDMLPTCQNLGCQQIGVGDQGAESSLENALSSHKAFRLSKQQALAEIRGVAQVVDGWQGYFQRLAVGDRDIELLHASIDRRLLRDQREWALR